MNTRTVPELAARFGEWARAAHGTAVRRRIHGDGFGEQLAEARSAAYSLAEQMAMDAEGDALAEMLWRQVHDLKSLSDSLPIINYDQVALRHVSAMAWQLCAWEVDPDHVQVEKPWTPH